MSAHPVDVPIDLSAAVETLLATALESGRAGRTICHLPTLRATLIALAAGHQLDEHNSPPAATLQVLRGQVVLQTRDRQWPLTAGHLVVIPRQRHALRAETDAVVLLTVQAD